MASLLLITSIITIGISHKFDYDPRIVNGLPTSADEYPWIVSLRQKVETTSGSIIEGSRCGASLIGLSPPVILTAASCFDSLTYNSTDMTIRDSINYIYDLYADVNRTYKLANTSNDTFYSIPIYFDNIYIHPLWNATEIFQQYAGYDIALVILTNYNESESDFTTKFEPLLPTILQSNNYYDNTACCSENEELTAIGYGRVAYEGPQSSVLRTTTLDYVDKVNCLEAMNKIFVPIFYQNDTGTFFVPNVTSVAELKQFLNENLLIGINDDRTICVLGNDTSICIGDAGSPLFRMNNQDKAEIVGVASYITGGSCNNESPDGYTNVASYYDWIMKVITLVVDGESYAPTMDPSQMPSASPIITPESAAHSINVVHIYAFIVYAIYGMV